MTEETPAAIIYRALTGIGPGYFTIGFQVSTNEPSQTDTGGVLVNVELEIETMNYEGTVIVHGSRDWIAEAMAMIAKAREREALAATAREELGAVDPFDEGRAVEDPVDPHA